jgi:hypothetical protein
MDFRRLLNLAIAVFVTVGLAVAPLAAVIDQSSGCMCENRDCRINFTRAELTADGVYIS